MSLRDNGIVIFLESLFPLLKVNIRKVKTTVEEYRLKASRVLDDAHAHLQHFYLLKDDFLLQFGSDEANGSLLPLYSLLETNIPNSGNTGVCVIDALLVLTIFCRGPIKEKCSVLFDMYSADTEHLTESQLVDLLMRIAHCAKKMKIVPSSEMSRDDIKHMAFLARIKPDGSGLFSTLLKKDFLHWITAGRDAAVAIKFIRVFNRMLDMVNSLNARVDKLVHIFDAKRASRNFALLKQPQGVIHSTHVLLAKNNIISIIVLSSSDVNIQCHAVCHTSHPLKNTGSSRLLVQNDECCERYYLKILTGEVSQTVHKHSFSGDVTATRYNMTSIAEHDTYHISLSTGLTQSALVLSAPPYAEQIRIRILPSAVDVDMFCTLRSADFSSDIEIFTGTICSVHKELQMLLESTSVPAHSSASILSVVSSIYEKRWFKCMDQLFATMNVKHTVDALSQRGSDDCLFYFSGIGPWCDTATREHIRALLPTEHGNLLGDIEHLYAEYEKTIALPDNFLIVGNIAFVFVSGMESGKVLSSIISFFEVLCTDAKKSSVTCVLLLVRQPDELLKAEAKTVQKSFSTKLSEERVDAEPAPVITGKHEILYGAQYGSSSNIAVTDFGDTTIDITTFFAALKRWQKQSLSHSRTTVLVSCAWAAGCNFNIIDSSDLVVLSHFALLPTSESYDATIPNTFAESAGRKHKANILEHTKLRSMSLHRRGGVVSHTFASIDSTHDMEVKPNVAGVLLKSPRIVKLGGTTVSFSLQYSRLCWMSCTIYQIPHGMSLTDVEILANSELRSLKAFKTEKSLCINFHDVVLDVTDLNPYTSYCAIFHAEDSPDKCLAVSAFTTLQHESGRIFTSFICGVDTKDINFGSDFVLVTLDQFDTRFSSVGPVHLYYNNDSCQLLHEHVLLHRLKRMTYVDTVHQCKGCTNTGSVTFRVNGLFAELSLLNDSSSCFDAASSVIDSLMSVHYDVTTVTVYVAKPVVPHAIYSSELGEWIKSKNFYQYKVSLERLLSKLLLWKRQSPRRDAILLCVIDISLCRFFTFNEADNSIRLLLLPRQHVASSEASNYVFPLRGGKIRSISFSTHDSSQLQALGKVSIVEPLLHLHPEELVQHSRTILYKQFTMSPSPALAVGYTSYHPVILKKILQDVDNFSIVLGPVVLNVTTSSSMILFEFNRKLNSLECILRNTMNFEDACYCVMPVNAYVPVVFSFNGMKSGVMYDVYIPTASAAKLGRVRTVNVTAEFSDVVFVGNQEIEHLSSVPRIVNDLHVQNCSCAETVEMESRLMELMNLSHNPSMNESWLKIGYYLSDLAATCDAIVYIGSHSLFPKIIHTILTPLFRLLERCGSPHFVVGRLFHANVETAVEDTFRLLWIMEPAIKLVLRSAPNIFLYHPDYMLQVLESSITEVSAEAGNRIRNMFMRKLQDYIFISRQWDMEKVHHFYTWRAKCLCVMSIDFCHEQVDDEEDIVEKSDDEGEDEVPLPKENTPSTPFTSNFMTPEQWWYVRRSLSDKYIFQLVLCLTSPLIPIAGDAAAENRSEEDVLIFLNYLIKWLITNENRTIVLMCASTFSYVTVIQDIKSGVKIIQCCIGSVMNGMKDAEKSEMRGKYGHYRYVHRVVGLTNVLLESCAYGNGGRYTGERISIGNTGVFGRMRFWFDTWKANGLFSIVPVREIQHVEVSVIVGPVVGAPRVIETSEGDRLMVPVLFEVDGDTTLEMTGINVFTGQVLTKSHVLKKYTPTVILFGPLHVDSRFVFKVVSGVQNVHALNIVLHTSINWNENNIAIINCRSNVSNASLDNEKCIGSSTFLRDLVTRCRIPFNGITAVVHTNIAISIDTILQEMRLDTRLEELLQASRASSTISAELKDKLSTILQRIRTEYRNYLSKPSYMELLRCSYNLFMFSGSNPTLTDETTRVVHLINARVRQEYFDQLVAPPESVFAALPKTDAKLQEDLRKAPVATVTDKCNDFDATFADYLQHLEYPLPHMEILDENDDDILRIPRKRMPDLVCQDPNMHPIDAICNQFMKHQLPSPPLWVPWYAPNDRVVVEDFCDITVDNIREIHDKILKSGIEYGSRIIIIQDASYFIQQKSMMGYKLCLWINKWIGNSYDKSITLLCPALYGEGSRRHDIAYYNENNWLSLYTIESLYHSNEEIIAQLKVEKFGEKKKRTTKFGGGGRRATERRKQEEAKQEEANNLELAKIYNSLPPDGYFIIEVRAISSKTDTPVFISTSNCRAVSSQTLTYDNDNYTSQNCLGDQYTVSMYDYLELPLWFQKLCPGRVGHYIQDEVAFLIQQEVKSKTAMSVLETDAQFQQDIMDVYKSSNLNELQLAPAMRRIDFTRPGVVLYFLKSIVQNIWENHIPDALKSRMVPLYDEFILSFCFYPAVADVSALSSPESFVATFSKACVVAIKIFLTTKMRLMKRWQYLLDVSEFVTPLPEYVESEDEAEAVENEEGEESAVNDAAVIETTDQTYDSKIRQKEEEEAKLSESEKIRRAEELKRQQEESEYYAIVEKLQSELTFASTSRIENRRHFASILGFIPPKTL